MVPEQKNFTDQPDPAFLPEWSTKEKASAWGFPCVLQNSVSRSQTRTKFTTWYRKGWLVVKANKSIEVVNTCSLTLTNTLVFLFGCRDGFRLFSPDRRVGGPNYINLGISAPPPLPHPPKREFNIYFFGVIEILGIPGEAFSPTQPPPPFPPIFAGSTFGWYYCNFSC